MFCPQCREEFPWQVMVCPACDVETVDRLPGPVPTPDAALVRVLAAGDPGVLAVAKSLLESAEIDYFVRGEGLQDLFGLGRITEYCFAVGPAEFWVREDDVDRARELLADLAASSEAHDPPHEA